MNKASHLEVAREVQPLRAKEQSALFAPIESEERRFQ
jgi:hypothetical protein